MSVETGYENHILPEEAYLARAAETIPPLPPYPDHVTDYSQLDAAALAPRPKSMWERPRFRRFMGAVATVAMLAGIIKTGLSTYEAGPDHFWTNAASSISSQSDQLRDAGELDYLNNPDRVAFMQLTDIHANLPYLEYFLPEMIEATGIETIVFTGDLYNGSDVASSVMDQIAKPMEKLEKIVLDAHERGKKLQFVIAGGNHDPKQFPKEFLDLELTDENGQSYHPFIQLDEPNSNRVTINGITYVGAPDNNRTSTPETNGTPYDTVPHERRDQIINNLHQGDMLAKIACDAEQETGKPVVVAMHEPEALFATAISLCASLLIAGHYHRTYPLLSYKTPDGAYYYFHVLGSASGDGPGSLVRIYQQPNIKASAEIYEMNTATNELEKTYLITVFPNGKTVIAVANAPEPENTGPFTEETATRFIGQNIPKQRTAVAAFFGN